MFDNLIKGHVATIQRNRYPLEHSTPGVMMDRGMLVCHSCGSVLRIDYRHCTNCGHDNDFVVRMDLSNEKEQEMPISYSKTPLVEDTEAHNWVLEKVAIDRKPRYICSKCGAVKHHRTRKDPLFTSYQCKPFTSTHATFTMDDLKRAKELMEAASIKNCEE